MTGPQTGKELRDSFGSGECDPDWFQVATYEAESEDGATCYVDVSRMPAVFYRIRTGDIAFTTGSGMHDLTVEVAKAIAQGMFGLERRTVRG